MPEQKPAVDDNVDETPQEASLTSSWVFIDRDAPVDEVQSLLATIDVPYSGGHGPSESPDSMGPVLERISMDRFLPYILPMSNTQKVKVPDPNNPQRTMEKRVLQTTLYTQVAGRLAILNEIADRRRWAVDIYPEKDVSTGVPGYLRFDDRLVFRVYVEISENGRSLGRRFGTAWAKAEGGFNAEGSNPYETVETSALGRALAQWGIGILPGSGIASVEEMRLAKTNQQTARSPQAGPAAERVREDRGDLITSAIDFIEKRRKLSGLTQEAVDSGINTWLVDKFGVDGFVSESGRYEWERLKDPQIALLRNSIRDAVVRAQAAGETSV